MKKTTFVLCFATSMMIPAWCSAQEPSATDWVLEPGKIIGGSSTESGARLMDPVMMDLDGDGLTDIIFGAPGTDPNGIVAAGSIYVIRGKKGQELTGSIDVTQWNSFDYRIDGHTPNGMLGMNLLTGDFNGDGFQDLAAAEPGGKGTVHIIYGGKKREQGIYDITGQNGADVSFTTSELNTNLGLTGCVGDFNRDGIDDLALSYIVHNASLASNMSQVVLLNMRREWDKKSYDIGSKIYGKTILSRPVSSTTRVLHTCAVGDFNDDNIPDIALGMPLDTYQKQKAIGSVTIIYQPQKYNGTIVDLSSLDEKIGIRINGNQPNAMFGYSLAAGDFTGDGRDDLAISAPNRLVKGPESEGAVYIYDANQWPAESCDQPQTMQITGNGGQFGYRLQTADANGDKRPDLIISAPTAGQTKDGALSVYLGGPYFTESNEENKRADITVSGADFMGFGLGAAFGDFNADGKIDAIVRTSADPQQRPTTGAYTVIGNFQELPQASTLSDNFMTIIAPGKGGGLSHDIQVVQYQNKSYYAWFSPKGMGNRSLICLTEKTEHLTSDINTASSTDCDIQIVGPENFPISTFTITQSPTQTPLLTIAVPDMPVNKAKGFVAIIPLPENITQPLVLNLTASTLKTEAQTYILSNESSSALGTKLEWRDLDRDGYDDLIIGAPKRKIDAETSGSVFIVKGKASLDKGIYELTGKNVIQYEGYSDEELGSQWQVLDFNNDGRLDLLIRAAHTPDAVGDEFATVYAVYDAGIRSPKAYNVRSPEMGCLRISAPHNRSGLEIIPQTFDINEDGADDLILISPEYRAGLQKLGMAYVVPSNENNKSGEMRLKDETHYIFSFVPGRNEKLVDVRFRRANGMLQFITAASDLTTGIASSVNIFVEKNNELFQGNHTESSLKRLRSEAKLPTPTRLSVIHDPELKYDELWLIFPTNGITQSGQGVAQKVKD